VRRRALLAVTPASALGLYWLPGLALYAPSISPLFGIRTRVPAAKGVVLTFDDGPHPQGTPAVLAELARHRVTATFFLVGEQVERRPALAQEIAAEGHEIAIHCHRHRSLLLLSPREVREDLRRASATIADATGKQPMVYRPPYGLFSFAGLIVAQRNGWERLLWTHAGYDWEPEATVDSIAGRLLTPRLRPSDVWLLHDADFYSVEGAWRRTVASLPVLFEELERRGLSAGPVRP
jgi:peptidoglycan-N-acetylglucosamine deacetylase